MEPGADASDDISDSIRRVGSTSAAQIDGLIAELTQLRERLQSDGERVQHEILRVQNQIAGYVETNEAVMESVTGIGRTLAQFKSATELKPPHQLNRRVSARATAPRLAPTVANAEPTCSPTPDDAPGRDAAQTITGREFDALGFGVADPN